MTSLSVAYSPAATLALTASAISSGSVMPSCRVVSLASYRIHDEATNPALAGLLCFT
jgi:hypothetical protein